MKMSFVKSKKYLQTTLILNLVLFANCILPVNVSAQKTLDKKLTPREIAQQTLPSTVLLVMGNSDTEEVKSGSGFFVAEDVVVTNFHVIKETTEGYAKIYGQEKIYEILGIVGTDEKNDLALLKIKGIKGKALKLNADDSAAIGDEVFAVGNPKGLEGTFSQGIVSSIRKTGKLNLLQITASISSGSSGGAVLNDKGEVIGVAVGAIESGQSLNFAIPVFLLRSLVLSQKPLTALKSLPTQNNVKTVKKNSIAMDLVYIPAGEFMMGGEDEKPIHKVTFKTGFWMSKYELTQGQWEKVMGTTLQQQREKVGSRLPVWGEGSNYPMYFLNWEDAKDFTSKLNAKNDGFVYSLPSEAQWEYAARAGTTSDHYGKLDDIAWYGDNSGNGEYPTVIHPVGQKQANAFGLYDISGNVSEWCEDVSSPNYNGTPTDGSPNIGRGGEFRIWRGGASNDNAYVTRSAFRGVSGKSASTIHRIGLRVVARIK